MTRVVRCGTLFDGTGADIAKVIGGNAMRVLDEVWWK